MIEKYPGALIVSRDGALGVYLDEFEGIYPIPNRDAVGAFFEAVLTPRAERTRVSVRFSGWTSEVNWSAFGLPDIAESDRRLAYFSEAAIGDYLDEYGLPPFTPSGVQAAAIDCFSERTSGWAQRSRASDEEIERYIEGKVLWAWKYELGGAHFHRPDCLRLSARLSSIQRVAILGDGERWDRVNTA